MGTVVYVYRLEKQNKNSKLLHFEMVIEARVDNQRIIVKQS